MLSEVERRPALIACLGLIVGLSTATHPLNSLFALAILWFGQLPPKLVGAAAFAVGGILGAPATRAPIADQGYVDAIGVVVSIPELSPLGRRNVVRFESGDYYLYSAGEDFSIGDRLHIEGVARPLSEAMDFARNRGILGTIRPTRINIESHGPSFARIGVAWRERFIQFCDETLTREAADAVGALCFNAGGRLDPRTKSNLQRTGTIHIISVSGLHVMIFAFGLSGLLSMFPIPRGAQLLVLMLVLALYATATGLQPPVVRAAAMAAILFAAYRLRREPDLLSALGLAAIAYLLWQPSAIFDIGFQLSFIAVAGLAMFLPIPELPHAPVLRLIAQAKLIGLASLVATVCSAPLVAYHFGVVSLIAVVSNVLIGIAVAPVTLVALASLGVAYISMPLAFGLMGLIVEPLVGWILLVVNGLGPLPFAAISVPPFSAYLLVPIYAAMLMTWRKRARQP